MPDFDILAVILAISTKARHVSPLSKLHTSLLQFMTLLAVASRIAKVVLN